MKQHFTKLTVEASVWCNPCAEKTQWAIQDGRPLHCLKCFGKLEVEHKKPKVKSEQQDTFNFRKLTNIP